MYVSVCVCVEVSSAEASLLCLVVLLHFVLPFAAHAHVYIFTHGYNTICTYSDILQTIPYVSVSGLYTT